MKTSMITPVLTGAMALVAVGCSTMQVTTIADVNHPRNLNEPVLLRFTLRDAPRQVHSFPPLDADKVALRLGSVVPTYAAP